MESIQMKLFCCGVPFSLKKIKFIDKAQLELKLVSQKSIWLHFSYFVFENLLYLADIIHEQA